MKNITLQKKEIVILENINEDFFIKNNINYGGIYFLYLKDCVVYIGMTIDSMANRIFGSHGKDGHAYNKIFDKIIMYEVEEPYLKRTAILNKEWELIKKYEPYYNIIGNTGKLKRKLSKVEQKLLDYENKVMAERFEKAFEEGFKKGFFNI